MTVAVFDYERWARRYPKLAQTVDPGTASELFADATAYLDNTDASVVPADPVTYDPRLGLLNKLVAHLAILESPERDGVVGRVSQAGQGSVSASMEMGPALGSSAWFMQTQPGASYWQATGVYRMGRYVPPARVRRCW